MTVYARTRVRAHLHFTNPPTNNFPIHNQQPIDSSTTSSRIDAAVADHARRRQASIRLIARK
jgi:hypothetical protein